MVRKTKVRRSVNAVGVKKHKISQTIQKTNFFEALEKLIPKKYFILLYKLSETCFNLFAKICCNLSWIPISVDSHMKFTVTNTKGKLAVHYSILALQFVRMLHIFVVTTNRTLNEGLDLRTFLCITCGLSYILGVTLSWSLLFLPYETVQIFNTVPVILSFYPKNGKVTTMFQNAKSTIFIVALGFVSNVGASMVTAFGIFVDRLPVSLCHVFETGRPQSIPPLMWKMLFGPMEWLMFLHTTVVGAFACMIIVTFPNIGMACTREMRYVVNKFETNSPTWQILTAKVHKALNYFRRMLVTTTESWMELRRKYYLLQVYFCLMNSWIKVMIVPTLTSVSGTIVILFYITLRHTEIEIFLYLAFVTLGVTFFVLMFWVGFEVIFLIQSTEVIVGTLNGNFAELEPLDRRFLNKYGKSTRQVVFDIGDFTEFSIGVLTSVWDEILNQLLFLLSF